MTDLSGTIEAEVAKELVKALLGGLLGLAKKVPALFGRSGKAKEDQVAEEVDRSARQLATVTGAELEREVIRQEATWEVLLRGLLRDHPEAAEPLRALAAELRAATGGGQQMTVYQQRNDGGSAGAQGPGATAHVHHYADRPAPAPEG